VRAVSTNAQLPAGMVRGIRIPPFNGPLCEAIHIRI
jgi:hypothetical protein